MLLLFCKFRFIEHLSYNIVGAIHESPARKCRIMVERAIRESPLRDYFKLFDKLEFD